MNAAEMNRLHDEALQQAQAATGSAELEAVRVRYLGRKGLLQEIMKGLGKVDPSERPQVGKLANELREELRSLLDSRKADLETAVLTETTFDYSMPGNWRQLGTRHPISRIIEDVVQIFARLGFTVADGPDIETGYYNFDALNTPPDHPSRNEKDTFWLETGQLLRTQTSPVQIRVMEKQKPPVRIIAPGRCFRRDTTDATHSANFHQIEGLYVDRKVSMADLKSDITYFAQEMMGPDVQVRFRPHFFPFTEPSVEYDFSCHCCNGKGCRVCGNSGWIEMAGAGMVDPRVFKLVGYDPGKFTGYAFGMGVERIGMIKYGITDIRMLYENDVRFLQQLG
jgi:phenylalanyl-tRNA synthetase alpha chain